jgi:nucleoside-diphosphate-sugar epimerase
VARVLVTGGGGFLGQRVVRSLMSAKRMMINGIERDLSSVSVVDRFVPEWMRDEGVDVIQGDLLALLENQAATFQSSDVVFHLASAVSGECEQDLDLGLKTNLETGIALGKTLAGAAHRPLLIFSSSLAIFGGTDDFPLPRLITDEVRPNPQNSYGSQKLMLETLYADLARRDQISIRTLRLMTVSVRPGKPNQAASGFLSGMIREPLSGLSSNVPVPLETEVALNSPEQAVGGLIRAMGISDSDWGSPLGLNLPGIRISIQGMIDALVQVAGSEVIGHLTFQPDYVIQNIVTGWPSRFESARASRLRLETNESFRSVVERFQDTR